MQDGVARRSWVLSARSYMERAYYCRAACVHRSCPRDEAWGLAGELRRGLPSVGRSHRSASVHQAGGADRRGCRTGSLPGGSAGRSCGNGSPGHSRSISVSMVQRFQCAPVTPPDGPASNRTARPVPARPSWSWSEPPPAGMPRANLSAKRALSPARRPSRVQLLVTPTRNRRTSTVAYDAKRIDGASPGPTARSSSAMVQPGLGASLRSSPQRHPDRRSLPHPAHHPGGTAPGTLPRSRSASRIFLFRTHRERMRYPAFRAQGLCVGSGVVEAGCQRIVGSRLKRSGMHGSVAGAHAMLALRCGTHPGNRFKDFWANRATTRRSIHHLTQCPVAATRHSLPSKGKSLGGNFRQCRNFRPNHPRKCPDLTIIPLHPLQRAGFDNSGQVWFNSSPLQTTGCWRPL